MLAIDGPAASGKGTLARMLANHYGLRHLDTGLLYRAVAELLVRDGNSLDNEDAAVKAAENLDLSALDRDHLSSHAIGEAASKVATLGGLRRALLTLQRDFACPPPGAVLDGRDIGTVVFPDASAKLYVTANPKVRAQRRAEEIALRFGKADKEEILADLERRDARDMARSDSPLKPAFDAHLLDTSEMTIEAAFEAAVDFVERARKRQQALD